MGHTDVRFQQQQKPITAFSSRDLPKVNPGYYPDHTLAIAAQPTMGAPHDRGISHKVEPSHVAGVGRIRRHPGVHLNIYTAIPYLQSIADKFWGIVRKVPTSQGIAIPRGVHQNKLAGYADINVPERTTYSSFATYVGNSDDVIRNGYSHVAR